MIKKIEFISELEGALAGGLVMMVEPDTGNTRYLTTKADLADSEAMATIRNVESFDSGRDLAVWDILEAQPITLTPVLFTGLLYDFGVNMPKANRDDADTPVIGDNFASGTFYRAGTTDKAEFMTKVAGSHPFLFKVREGESEDETVLQVNEYGMNTSGFKKISAYPTYSEDEALIEVTGYLILSKTEGPIFMSHALAMGQLDKPTPGVDLSDGGMMIKAIQHVHRDAGVIGYTFNA